MKKKLIGFSVCIMLVTIAFVPNIAADENTSDILVFSEEEYLELRDKLLELDSYLLAAATLEQAESVIRDIVVLLDDYDLLPDDTTVDQEVELMKTCYIEQEQLEDQPADVIENGIDSSNSLDVTMVKTVKNTEILSKDTIIEEELTKSTVIMKQSQPIGPDGWSYLHPALWHVVGFQLLGKSYFDECFYSLNINIRETSGSIRFGPIRLTLNYNDEGDYKYFTYWYILFGYGTFDIELNWMLFGDPEDETYHATLRGFRVYDESYP